MAVYKYESGEFTKLAASLDDLDGTFKEWKGLVGEFATSKGMVLLDDVDGVYELYCRNPSNQTFSRLREYRWWFRLVDELGVADDVMIPDSLPDFLAFVGQLQPLVIRAEALVREVRESLQ